MQTEDHPFAYGTFEGVIPEGYGAGIVMLWDRGTWTPESPDVDAALRKGDLKFTLDGYKLKGSWALIRTRGFGGGSKPSWLLIKHQRRMGRPGDITEFAPLSVKTPEADFADILAADNPYVWRSNAPGEKRRRRQVVPAHHRAGGGDEGPGDTKSPKAKARRRRRQQTKPTKAAAKPTKAGTGKAKRGSPTKTATKKCEEARSARSRNAKPG